MAEISNPSSLLDDLGLDRIEDLSRFGSDVLPERVAREELSVAKSSLKKGVNIGDVPDNSHFGRHSY